MEIHQLNKEEITKDKSKGEVMNQFIKKFCSNSILVYDCNKRIIPKLKGSIKNNKQIFLKQNSLVKSTKVYNKAFLSNIQQLQNQTTKQFAKSQQQQQQTQIRQLQNQSFFLQIEQESDVFFNSKFESGNLFQAYRIQKCEYNLLLNFDSMQEKYCQWFFFSVKNIASNTTIRINILNLMKNNIANQNEVQPVIFSVKQHQQYSQGWKRNVNDVSYQKSLTISNKDVPSSITFYKLSFSYTFSNEFDIVYIAQSYPYTYSMLEHYLYKKSKQKSQKFNFSYQILAKTPEENNIYYVELSKTSKNNQQLKKAIVLTGRIHPGESVSSYVIKGIIDFLTSEHQLASRLLSLFDFKIIPMINPDGVKNGNYRCSFEGIDLNRKWINNQNYFEQQNTVQILENIKNIIKNIKLAQEIFLFCDFHGHQRETDCFMYCCKNQNNNYDKSILLNELNSSIQIFPFLLSNLDFCFSFKKCSFANEKNKEATARVVMFSNPDFNIQNSYTLEASMLGSCKASKNGKQNSLQISNSQPLPNRQNSAQNFYNSKKKSQKLPAYLMDSNDYQELGYSFLISLLLMTKDNVVNDAKFLLQQKNKKLHDLFRNQLQRIKNSYKMNPKIKKKAVRKRKSQIQSQINFYKELGLDQFIEQKNVIPKQNIQKQDRQQSKKLIKPNSNQLQYPYIEIKPHLNQKEFSFNEQQKEQVKQDKKLLLKSLNLTPKIIKFQQCTSPHQSGVKIQIKKDLNLKTKQNQITLSKVIKGNLDLQIKQINLYNKQMGSISQSYSKLQINNKINLDTQSQQQQQQKIKVPYQKFQEKSNINTCFSDQQLLLIQNTNILIKNNK